MSNDNLNGANQPVPDVKPSIRVTRLIYKILQGMQPVQLDQPVAGVILVSVDPDMNINVHSVDIPNEFRAKILETVIDGLKPKSSVILPDTSLKV